MNLTVADLERVQAKLDGDYRVELVNGDIVVMSPSGYESDSLIGLRTKIDRFLEQGTLVGILIHPEQRWLEMWRLGQEPIQLKDGDILTLPDLIPGWQLPISDLWSPVFEE